MAKKLAKHYVRVETNVPEYQAKVSIHRKSNTSACTFDFQICAMADNLTFEGKVSLAKVMVESLDAAL